MKKEIEIVAAKISELAKEKELFIIGISGFGGSGKTTMAVKVAERLGDTNIVSMDSFSSDFAWKKDGEWSNFNRQKMLLEVIGPAINKLWPIYYEHRPWPKTKPDKIIELEKKKFLVIEGCGIYHPEIVQFFDYKIWIDVSLAKATEGGIKRDNNSNVEKLWKEIFMPNEREFFEKYKPDRIADCLINSYE